ncbi:uncharacterized protein PAC_01044 [Phialocephala subalpina]|uniref:Uncharacterized protein n=1 Tax=Phialocephala subalpina TaxID=576137 RepID=A0A1L7WEM3_9HELO|nr:uncharacterized protein PAC_01044 [Phialocephala subalpina]
MSLTMSPTDLLAVMNVATQCISRSTSYLSTLPHPIEPLEELISVIAVASTLLSSLQTAIDRFPELEFSTTHSFLNPLAQDILYAISQLNGKVEDAKRSKVFQPNDVGLVRLPRNAWILINGNEAKAASLRSRLYVEKYRVRVLIDAVNWYGLRSLDMRNQEEEIEYQGLRNRLGLIAERLVGVWRDYSPRLKALENGANPFADQTEVERQRNIQRAMQMQMQAAMMNQQAQQQQAQNQPPRYEASMEQDQLRRQQEAAATQQAIEVQSAPPMPTTIDEKKTLQRNDKCNSVSNSDTVSTDTKFETYLLRRNPSTRTLKSSTRIFNIPFLVHKTHTHKEATHYIKPLPSSASEISLFRIQSQASLSPAQHMIYIKKRILAMPDDAQWEIQKLCESKESATSSSKVRREWEVVGFVERPRRKINHASVQKRRWWRRSNRVDKRDLVEWVLVLKGETVDKQERIMPGKNSNPWEEKKPKQESVEVVAQRQAREQRQAAQAQQQAMQAQQAQIQCQNQIQNPASVLRHVEQRRTMGVEEAEVRMDEMLRDLFKFEDSDSEDGDDNEDEDEDMDAEGGCGR